MSISAFPIDELLHTGVCVLASYLLALFRAVVSTFTLFASLKLCSRCNSVTVVTDLSSVNIRVILFFPLVRVDVVNCFSLDVLFADVVIFFCTNYVFFTCLFCFVYGVAIRFICNHSFTVICLSFLKLLVPCGTWICFLFLRPDIGHRWRSLRSSVYSFSCDDLVNSRHSRAI